MKALPLQGGFVLYVKERGFRKNQKTLAGAVFSANVGGKRFIILLK